MPHSTAPLPAATLGTGHLRTPDLILIAVYLLAITLFGLRFRSKGKDGKPDRSLKSYFLASNTIPWWAIALSVVSAETSTLTIVSIPGVAFAGDFGFLQLVLGYLVGRVVVALLFLPRYFAGEMLTAYQLIDRRFGPTLHKVTAGLFLVTRAAAEGVRVFAVSIVVGIAIGTGDVLSIAIISALTLLYTFEGGMAAVIWTDVVQMAIYIGGTVVALITLGHHIPGGWPAITHAAHTAGKLHMFNFALNRTPHFWSQPYTFWAGLLGGTFLTMASHGTDQLMVQRLLAARNLRQSQAALLSSGVVIFFQFAFFLLIGIGLWVFYGLGTTNPGAPHLASEMWARTVSPDRLFPTYIVREMPIGIAGLLIAAILAAAMSNLSAALNSLSSTTVVDFYLRFRQPRTRLPHTETPASPSLHSTSRTVISTEAKRSGETPASPSLHSTSQTVISTEAKRSEEPPASPSLRSTSQTVISTEAKRSGETPVFAPAHAPGADPVSDRERILVSKASTALWAIVLFAIAVYSIRAGGKGHVVEIGLSIAAVAYGCLLGVFLLGTLTRFATEYGAIIGMICGFALNLWLWQGTFPVHLGFYHQFALCRTNQACPPATFLLTIPHIAFTWYVLIGAIVTFAIGSLASLFLGRSTRHRTARVTATAATLLPLFLLSFPQGICVSQAQAQAPAPQTPSSAQFAPSTSPSSRPERSEVERPPYLATLAPPQTPSAPQTPGAPSSPTASSSAKVGSTDADFSLVSQLITTAIAQQKLPGAVVLIGHNNQIVFEHAYGNRKLAGEPGLDGQPSPAEPMTEDTVFDMASLSKNLVTSLAIGQLYDQHKLDFDTPVDHYLPDFNPAVNGKTDPERSKVTLRLLLTHFSGEPPDVNLKDPWGLAHPDKAEGIHRALTTPLASTPGTKFVYSDINFILLGGLVEKLSGEPLDEYAQQHIFEPLRMTQTAYHSLDHICKHGYLRVGAATMPDENHAELDLIGADIPKLCAGSLWNIESDFNTAPTAHDDEGTPETNPNYNHLLRGTVHDPTTRRMGGVAGHAGVFSTAHDTALFAQALLDKLTKNTGPFPLSQSTLQLMTQPEQPGHNPNQLAAANAANLAAIAAGQKPATGNPALLDPNFPAIPGQTLRGFGWDIDSVFSKPRGRFPIGSFGHTGFTGTSLWLDPGSNTYVILLSNAIHPHAGAPISNLRGEVATAAAAALNLYASPVMSSAPAPRVSSRPERSVVERPAVSAVGAATDVANRQDQTYLAPEARIVPFPSCEDLKNKPLTDQEIKAQAACPGPPFTSCVFVRSCRSGPALETIAAETNRLIQPTSRTPGAPSSRPVSSGAKVGAPAEGPQTPTLTGLDVLESTHFAALTQLNRLGLLTNQTGLDHLGHRTVDILYTALPKTLPQAHLTTLFSPEHGIFGAQDTEHVHAETDPTTGLHVTSLYGPHDSDKRPSHDQLKDLDAVVIDLQDAGVRCYTYETVVGYFLEAAAHEKSTYNHPLEIIVLDRPNPIGGVQIGGPISDPGTESYINYMPLPLRHGLTLGELARYINTSKHLNANLTVVPMQHWSRAEYFTDTGLPFTPPSPNLRSPTAETLYPATAFLEYTNLSIGRGTEAPFELFGAGSSPTKNGQRSTDNPQPWFNGHVVATALNARNIPGVRFEATHVAVAEDANHYPFHGQTIEAVRLILTDRNALDTSEVGLELLSALHELYPTHFDLERAMHLIASRSTLDAISRGEDPRSIAASWQPALDRFRTDRQASLLY